MGVTVGRDVAVAVGLGPTQFFKITGTQNRRLSVLTGLRVAVGVLVPADGVWVRVGVLVAVGGAPVGLLLGVADGVAGTASPFQRW